MKTLKREEIYAREYDELEHLRANIEEFIDSITIGSDCTPRWATDRAPRLRKRSVAILTRRFWVAV
jgi:hypothetical protein